MNFESLFTREDRGVSPVVGVILMVAITVILAAVIGTFVLDLGSNVQQNPQAGVTFSEEGTDVVVQVISMENADYVYVPTADGANGAATDFSGFVDETDEQRLTSVGDSGTVTTSGSGSSVTVIGVLGDKEAVLQTYNIE